MNVAWSLFLACWPLTFLVFGWLDQNGHKNHDGEGSPDA